MRRLARNVALVLTVLSVAVALWHIREGVVLFIVSLAVAATVRPIVDYLAQHGWPRAAALGVVFLSCLVTLIGLFVVIANPLMTDCAVRPTPW